MSTGGQDAKLFARVSPLQISLHVQKPPSLSLASIFFEKQAPFAYGEPPRWLDSDELYIGRFFGVPDLELGYRVAGRYPIVPAGHVAQN